MVHAQRAREFQWLALHLAKSKWPELEATQEQDDGGEDATSFFVGSDGRRRRLACSLTGTLRKVREDAGRLRARGVQIDVLVFATPIAVTNLTVSNWQEAVQKEFKHGLHVIAQAELVTLLEEPRHAWLCRSYLHLDSADEPGFTDLGATARLAAARTLAAWKAEYRYDQIQAVELTLSRQMNKPEGRATLDGGSHPVTLAQVVALLGERRSVILAGPPGAGKTFTLIQLADQLLQGVGSAIPLLVSLPGWASSRRDLLAYLGQQLAVHGLDSLGLSRLSSAGRVAFLLNGWNEIAEDLVAETATQLRSFALSYPGAPLAVSTRTTRLAPPLPRGATVHVEPLSPDQKLSIIQGAGLGDPSWLLRTLETNQSLSDVTNTPLFLAAIVDSARSGERLPTTRSGILGSFIEQTEISPEHSTALSVGPCAGLHRRYLDHIAGTMTSSGVTRLTSEELLETVAGCSKALHSEGHLGLPPNSPSVAECLAQHHLLVLSPSLGGVYRFIHQQFQEWFAAEWLYRRVVQLAKEESPDRVFGFQRDVLNHTRWREPVSFLMERVVQAGDEQYPLAGKLIRWAMPVDLPMAAELAGLAGEPVWPLVRDELSTTLRKWYARNGQHHGGCALAAMLATKSPDFQDVLWPLLESDDQQVRLRIHTAWRPFPLTSLGPAWRERFGEWDEHRRSEFVRVMCWDKSQEHIGLAIDLARTDRSLEVRAACLCLMEEAGAHQTLAEALADTGPDQWPSIAHEGVLQRMPRELLRRFATQMKEALSSIPELGTRRRVFDALHTAGDPDWPDMVKAEMNRLMAMPGTSCRPGDDRVGRGGSAADQPNVAPDIASYLRAVHEVAPGWALGWVAEQLRRGQLWWEPFTDYLVGMSDEVLATLVPVALDPTLDANRGLTRACQFARSGSAVATRALIKEYLAFSRQKANGALVASPSRGDVLTAGVRELPLSRLVDALVLEAARPAGSDGLRELVRLVPPDACQAPEFATQLSERQRDSLRAIALRPEVTDPPDASGKADLRAHLALLLGAVGKPEDAAVLEAWVHEERKRLVEEHVEWQVRVQAWEASGHRAPHPGGRCAVVYWPWYQKALEQLGSTTACEVLLRLLRFSELLGCAAWGLVRLSRTQDRQSGSVLGPRPKYLEIYDRRQHREPPGNSLGGVAKRHADAILGAIQSFLPEAGKEGTRFPRQELVTAAAALAGLSDTRAVPLLVTLSSIKHSEWTIAQALHGLVLGGSVVSGTEVSVALEPFIAEHEKATCGSGNDNWHVVQQCLAVLLFSDCPALGVERMRRLPPGRLRSYHARELLQLLGACRAPEAVGLLTELSVVTEIQEHFLPELAAALSEHADPRARQALLGLLDQASKATLPGGHNAVHGLVRTIAHLATADETVWAEVRARCKGARLATERKILAAILSEVGTDAAALAVCDLIHDQFPVPHDMVRLVESTLENRIPAGSPGCCHVTPREAAGLRKRLLNIALSDPTRKTRALELLAVIAKHRLECGLPADEPLHPDIELLREIHSPWPLLS